VFAVDRPEFERQVAMLCAAYNVPAGERGEAYWNAFNRLGLIEFARMVAHIIGPEGPDKLPTVPQLWKIRKELGKANQAQGKPGTQDLLTAVVETALRKWQLSELQIRQTWNWIARDPGGPDCNMLGVIIPQDPMDPVRFPAHRLMVSELTQEKRRV